MASPYIVKDFLMAKSNFCNVLNSQNIFNDIDSLPSNISLEEVQDFLNIDNWSHSKTFKNNYKTLKTYTYFKYNILDYWCMRLTSIDSIDEKTFREQFVLNLSGYVYNGSEYMIPEEKADYRVLKEQEYIHSIVKTDVLKRDIRANNAVVQFKNTYKLKPSILSKRKFYQWVYIAKPVKVDNNEISYVITLRSEPDDNERIKCYYVSIEMLKYNIDEQKLEWYMATTSDAGGNIPKFLQRWGIDNAIVEDVPSFLKYINY